MVSVEPSMEDILASIRRIIAADQNVGPGRVFGSPLATPAAATADVSANLPPPQPIEEPADPVAMMPQGDGSASAASAEAHPNDVLLDSRSAATSRVTPERSDADPIAWSPRPDAHFTYPVEGPARAAGPDHEPLLSSNAGASVSSLFQTLANTVIVQDPEMVERLTREALRPMLKTWLDDNLPSMVERLVRAEIERVARGGRSRD